MRCSTSSSCTWKALVSAGTTTILPPLAVMKGAYSGKNGAMTMISLSPSTTRALITEIRAGAAPQVKNSSLLRISRPKRRERSAAIAARGSSKPGAME